MIDVHKIVQALGILAVILIICMSSCNNSTSTVPVVASNKTDSVVPVAPPDRIKIIETNNASSTTFYIIKVDGCEYLASYHGGIIPLGR